jgi:hypothetical protein
MSNLAGMPPLGLKIEKGADNPKYLAGVRGMPCWICREWGMRQNSPTEAHHCKSGRYSQLREEDEKAIPLCHSHHHKLRKYLGDEDKIGYHNAQETWEARYGLDTDWIARTQDALAHLLRKRK